MVRHANSEWAEKVQDIRVRGSPVPGVLATAAGHTGGIGFPDDKHGVHLFSMCSPNGCECGRLCGKGGNARSTLYAGQGDTT